MLSHKDTNRVFFLFLSSVCGIRGDESIRLLMSFWEDQPKVRAGTAGTPRSWNDPNTDNSRCVWVGELALLPRQ